MMIDILTCFVGIIGVKQDAIDLMLGNYRPDTSASSPFVPRPGQESLVNILIPLPMHNSTKELTYQSDSSLYHYDGHPCRPTTSPKLS